MSLTQTGDPGWLPTSAFGLSALTTVISLVLPDAPEVEVDVPGVDKLVHLLLFAVLALTATWRFGTRLAVGIALLLYAGGTEVVQAVLLPNRTGDVYDVLADVAGAVLGLSVADAWRRARPGSVADDIRS